jgi:very-short-patch-repair endonuclease
MNTSHAARQRSLSAAALARSKFSVEKKSEIGRKRRSHVKMSGRDMRRLQQETINSDPVLYERYCEKRRKIAKDFHASMSNEEKAEYYSKVLSKRGISKAEDRFFDILSSNGLVFDRSQNINGFVVDGLDVEKKLIIEFYGDTFHCNPRKFNDPEQYCPWIRRTVGEQWNRDRKRLAVFYALGYKVLIVWQENWDRNQQVEMERIANALRSC